MTTPVKWGAEIPVNTTAFSSQDQPHIAALAGGRFVAVWRDIGQTGGDTSGQAVRAQMFNADGSKFGAEFLVNATTANDQYNPAVVALSNGGFVVTWNTINSAGVDTSQSAVAAQIFDASGARLGGEFIVNTTTASAQNLPEGAAFASGQFVITWTDFSGAGDTAPAGIRAQIFNPNGSKFGGEMLVNSTTAGNQVYSTIATLANGHFVVAWTDSSKTGADTSSSAIRARVFNSLGAPLAADFVVNTTTQGEQLVPHVTGLAGGRFVVSWTDFSQTGADKAGYAVRAQVFNPDGSRSGSEFLVNTTTANDQLSSVMTPLPDGRFVAAWLNVVAGYAEVHAQVFNFDGSKAGEQFTVNADEFTYLNAPSIATLPDGRLVVSFIRENDTSSIGIAAQIIDPREGPVFLTGTALEDQYIGTAYTDVMHGGAGADRLQGGDGNDTLVGGAGADVLDGGAGLDTASYADSPARVIVSLDGSVKNAGGDAVGDTLINIENLLGSIYGDALVGDDKDNALSGLGGNDSLKGGGGNDILIGGFGNDGLSGGEGDDTAVYAGDLGQFTVVDFGPIQGVSGPDGDDELEGIEHLQFNDGRVDLVDGSALFDTLHYMRQNLDVFHAGANALDHYDIHGWREGRNPNPLFDTSGYLAVNKDVAAADINPLDHYHQSGWREGRDPSAWFDTAIYLARNPDVAAAGIDPLEHYLAYGRVEDRKAYAAVGPISGGFDAQFYLFRNPDVAAAGVDPLEHFNIFGWREGRNPNAWFDTAGYLAHYADVAAAGVNPLKHYQTFGWREGRDPSFDFDTLQYLAANPDVDAAQVNPLEHFLLFGLYEGRNAVNGGWM